MYAWQIFFNILHYTSSLTVSTNPRMRTGVSACFLLTEIFTHSSLKVPTIQIHIRIIAKANVKTYLRLSSGSPNIAEYLNAGANSRVPFHFKKYRRQTRSFYSFLRLSFETKSITERKRFPRTIVNGHYLTGRVGGQYRQSMWEVGSLGKSPPEPGHASGQITGHAATIACIFQPRTVSYRNEYEFRRHRHFTAVTLVLKAVAE
jgi:hypothetical protein